MSDPIIKVENLSKRYRIGMHERKADTFAQQVVNVLRYPIDNFRKIKNLGSFHGEEDGGIHFALKDVSFEVMQGEVLGIIGKNGAGKSTLLKILSKITEPTSGRIELNGRVAALLEVGTGFHPELTGRENIYMNGTILGMTKKEIDRKLDEIIDFSGVEKYMDTPVKFYSSGMRVRLGFSVAAHLEPEILVIDEVLAVGDFEFQKKCLGKMKDVSEKEGRTVLFVSHQMDAITRLCTRVLLFTNGEITFNGHPTTSIKKYLGKDENQTGGIVNFTKKSEKQIVSLKSICLKSNSQILNSSVDVRNAILVEITFEVYKDGLAVSPGINVYNEYGDHLFTSHNVEYMINTRPFKKGCYQTEVTIPSNFLAEGIVFFSIALIQYYPFIVFQNEEKILSLTITDTVDGNSARGIYGGYFPGLVRPKLVWGKIKSIK